MAVLKVKAQTRIPYYVRPLLGVSTSYLISFVSLEADAQTENNLTATRHIDRWLVRLIQKGLAKDTDNAMYTLHGTYFD